MSVISSFEFSASRHASMRIQQRGVFGNDLDVFLEIADHIEPAKRGCEVWMLSRQALKELSKSGMEPQRIERLSRYRVVMDGETVVTVTKTIRH